DNDAEPVFRAVSSLQAQKAKRATAIEKKPPAGPAKRATAIEALKAEKEPAAIEVPTSVRARGREGGFSVDR
ncbi:unnamed protein product, partial [Rotaria sordida]